MTSKLNIFNSLPQHASDSDDEVNVKNAKTKTKHEKQDQRRHDNEKGNVRGQAAPRDNNEKEDASRQKNAPRTKGVTADPHPQDRQSGTGHQAYGNKPKKGGAGKGNVGSYKEDRRNAEDVPEGDESPVAAPEEEKPEGMTLAEYLANKKVVSSEPQVNEAKSKITSDQLKKELGKATALKTKLQQDIDDKRVGKKKDRLDINHKAGINSDHADLLSFRTGFVEREYKERTRDGEPQQARRQGGERRRREDEPAQPEGEVAHTEATQPQEGAAETTTAAPTEGQTQTQTQTQPKTEGQGERRRYEGQREGQRNDRGGYKGKSDTRKPYTKPGQTKVNFEDESLFPKLG